MNKKHILKIVLAVVLCIAMVLPFVPVKVSGAAVNNFDVGDDFKGLKLSVIGDSISTYEGITNSKTYNPLYLSTTEATFGTYYGDGTRTDYADYDQVKFDDTWWKQTVDALGMDLLVNNAWSGSYVLKDNAKGNTTEYGAAGYKDRSVNLHNGSTNPDIIAVYLGTNDVANYTTTTIGTKADVDTDAERNALYTSLNSYTAPTSAVQAYYIMISRIVEKYPDAEVYCFTVTHTRDTMIKDKENAMSAYNAGVRYIVEYFETTAKKNVHLVDLNSTSIGTGITSNANVRDYYYANNVHPDTTGMDMITSCFISELLEHSKKDKGTATTTEVSYTLTNSFVATGLARRAVVGKSFSVTLLPYEDYQVIDLTVTMGGKDVTAAATHGDTVYIEEVTGPITITAKAASKENDAYYWTAGSTALESIEDYNYAYNPLTDTGAKAGTYTAGTFNATGIQYSLEETVTLKHDKPWVIEFKGGGTFASGIMLLNNTAASSVDGNLYIHIQTTDVFLGYWNSGGSSRYHNSGISWEIIAKKMGWADTTEREKSHTFRLVNRPSDDGTTNMVYLFVDGVEIGAMNQTLKYGGTATTSGIDISGKDFVFNYMGTSDHPLRNCSISYIMVDENSETITKDDYNNYRWAGVGEGLTSVDDDSYFTENVANLLGGSSANGVEDDSYYSLDKSIELMHDRSWNIEFKAKGNWNGTRPGTNSGGDPMLFATSNVNNAPGGYYIYRPASDLIALGVREDGTHKNYGIKLTDEDIYLNDNQFYVYRFENRVEYNDDGTYKSNMVHLYLDGVEVGAMNNYFKGGTYQNTTSDWISGKDFVFNYMGIASYPLDDCVIDYIQVWESGYSYTADTSRLEYLINNKLVGGDSYDATAWTNYNSVITAGENLLDDVDINQDKVDAAVDDIIDTRNKLVKTATATKIHSVELVTGDYARIGEMVGLRIVTSPDVAQVGVGSRTFVINTSHIQNIEIGGVDTEVKVWLVGFYRDSNSANDDEKSITYTIGAYTDPNVSHDVTTNKDYQANTSFSVPYSATYVTNVTITKVPTKTVYSAGDEVDTTGMEVQATWYNSLTKTSETKNVTDYTVENSKLSGTDTAIIVNVEGATATTPVTVYTNVSDLSRYYYSGDELIVEGYYVGVAQEGVSGDNEILIKDVTTDDVIAVRNGYTALPDPTYSVGDKLRITATLTVDGTANTPYKRYLAASKIEEIDGDVDTVSYSLNNVVEVSSWKEMQELFEVGAIEEYTYIKFTGTMYFSMYTSTSDPVYSYRLHMNADAVDTIEDSTERVKQIKPDEVRCVAIRNNVLTENLGSDVIADIIDEAAAKSAYPGEDVTGELIALYTGANGSYFQLTILDADWIDLEAAA